MEPIKQIVDAAFVIANTRNGHTFAVNKTAAKIAELFKSELDDEQIAEYLATHYNKPIEECRLYVENILSNLKRCKFSPTNIRIIAVEENNPPLLYLQIDINWDCNLRCKHCYITNQSKNTGSNNCLTVEEWKCVLDQAETMQVPSIAILGGEPMLSPFFFEISKYAADKGFKIYSTTNATLINSTVAKKFVESGYIDLDVSLDGSCASEHEFLRGANTFCKTIEGIKYLVEAGIKVKIACILHKKNINSVKNILSLARDLKVHHVYFNSILPGGEGADIFDDMNLSKEEWSKVLETTNTWNDEKQRPKAFAEPRFVFERFDAKRYSLADKFVFSGCKAGVREIAINPDGYAVACPLLTSDKRFWTSNVRDHSLSEIWKNDKSVNDFRRINKSNLTQVCQNCTHVDMCLGGCHVAAFQATGSLTEKDPKCQTNKP